MPEPFVLIVGDSISAGYTPLVQKMLAGKYRIERPSENGGTSANVLAHLDEWAIRRQPDIVHFNAGLHDIAIDPGKQTGRQAPEQYEANLREIVRLLKRRTKARLIWATTTPVIDERHARAKGFRRRQADVEEYNRIALRVMKDEGIEIDDLHAVVQGAGVEDCLTGDGVHMTDKGNRVLAEAVARSIRGAEKAA